MPEARRGAGAPAGSSCRCAAERRRGAGGPEPAHRVRGAGGCGRAVLGGRKGAVGPSRQYVLPPTGGEQLKAGLFVAWCAIGLILDAIVSPLQIPIATADERAPRSNPPAPSAAAGQPCSFASPRHPRFCFHALHCIDQTETLRPEELSAHNGPTQPLHMSCAAAARGPARAAADAAAPVECLCRRHVPPPQAACARQPSAVISDSVS